ncbi:hypothetical protein BST61_g6217 [Cercospora zeina]
MHCRQQIWTNNRSRGFYDNQDHCLRDTVATRAKQDKTLQRVKLERLNRFFSPSSWSTSPRLHYSTTIDVPFFCLTKELDYFTHSTSPLFLSQPLYCSAISRSWPDPTLDQFFAFYPLN